MSKPIIGMELDRFNFGTGVVTDIRHLSQSVTIRWAGAMIGEEDYFLEQFEYNILCRHWKITSIPKKEVDADELVKQADWSPDDSFGMGLRDFIADRLDSEYFSRSSILDDLRSFYSDFVVSSIENAWIDLYGEEDDE